MLSAGLVLAAAAEVPDILEISFYYYLELAWWCSSEALAGESSRFGVVPLPPDRSVLEP
jgi:hypothetical protein